MAKVNRPLSPHLSIYRWQISMLTSILHRITGVALYVGLLLMIVFLCVVAYAPENYARLHECFTSVCGRLLLFGWTLAFYYHFFNGIRHMLWDIGQGLDVPSANRSGLGVFMFTVICTIASWAIAYHNAGVL